MPGIPQDISRLLVAWSKGDEEALTRLMSLVYPELRRIARQHLRRRTSEHTLESAALANEAYLKLIRARGVPCQNVATVIRRIFEDRLVLSHKLHTEARRGQPAL